VASFDSNDFGRRLGLLVPQSWFTTAALQPGGTAYGILGGVGSGLASVYGNLVYTKMQTRLTTATDTNLDNAALDFFGPGVLPRAAGESDLSYAFRIRTQVTVPQPTLAGIQRVVTLYLLAFTSANLASRVLALDVGGGLDVFGVLDGFSQNTPSIPSVSVFDAQSNPALAATVSPTPITAPKFCILLTYKNPSGINGFFAGRTHLTSTAIPTANRQSYVLPNKVVIGNAISVGFDALVRQVKAAGTIPIYANTTT